MRDADCVAFLQWCLPRLQLRWEGFRKVRGQVCKRISRRLETLGLANLEAYREWLEREPAEWEYLDSACRITISRFYRDRGVFDRLVRDVLPVLAPRVRCWSAGCASGEEPYTLAICWRHRTASTKSRGYQPPSGCEDDLHIIATDVDFHMLDRAKKGCYQKGTLKELPAAMIDVAFDENGTKAEPYCLKEAYREGIKFLQHDVRHPPPAGPFDLILCRNLVFMYFSVELQRKSLMQFASVLRPGGALIIGKHETLPASDAIEPWFPDEGIFRRTT